MPEDEKTTDESGPEEKTGVVTPAKPKAKAGKKTFVDQVWDTLASVKLAIVIFIFIAGTSIIGTIIEQNVEPAKNIEVIRSLFGHTLAPVLYGAFERLGFMDMYRSWWFVGFLLLFAANLTICSIDRFPNIWKQVSKPIKPLSPEHLFAIPNRQELTLQGKPSEIKETVLKAVGKAGFKVQEAQSAGGTQFYGEKWRYSRLGVFVTHLSILVILVGAIIGIFFGFKGTLNLPEGQAYSVAFGRGRPVTQQEVNEQNMIIDALTRSNGDLEKAAASLVVDRKNFVNRMHRYGIESLGFFLRLDDFDVDFYGRSDTAREYSSVLTIIDGGQEIITKRIEVNDPLKYKGYTFYQSSYGLLQGDENNRFVIKATSSAGAAETFKLPLGAKFTVPGTSIEATITEFMPSLAFDPSGEPYNYAQMMNNPGVRLEVSDGQNKYLKWVLKRYPATWSLSGGHVLQLVDVWGAQYTGLQVRRDPGVGIVYLGCFLMSVGLIAAFFTSHKKLWVQLSPAKGNTKITIAASANKNREALQRKVEAMVSHLQGGGK